MENSQLPSPATQPVQSLPALADPSYTLPSSPTNTPSTSTTAPALPLLFSPLNSSISPSFWQELTRRKLFELQLSTDPLPVYASYARGRSTTDRATGEEISFGCLLELSFEPTGASPARVQLRGILQNFNTIEEFKSVDKTALMESIGDEIWPRCTTTTPTSLEDLNPFLMITFADLKKYKYWYWCGFPAVLQKPGWETETEWTSVDSTLSSIEIQSIHEHQETPPSLSLARPTLNGSLEFAPLSAVPSFFDNVAEDKRTLVFLDPSSHPQAPGWPLRNVLTYLSTAHSISKIRVVAFRDSEGTTSHSRIATVSRMVDASGSTLERTRPSVVGWEKNEKGRLGPRMADLAPLMDPTRLADQAVDLNLQLMRWRIMPSLDLEKVKETKVLLLGAGTLGCYVARTLLAWGVRKISLVDSSTVSFSNPVRQPLFDFADSLEGGKPKAQAAAASLKRIYPGVDATGVTLSIPMPGHPISPGLLEKTAEDVKVLEELIDSHDVIYLLMDSRESRWLPTVIGASKRKLVMNVALGFDTYLVMRHGVPSPIDAPSPATPAAVVVPGQPYTGRLGCYYCNDIVAPMDSLTDRTLDQMCTVTRPGIAAIASATSVELMVSILQHPLGSSAPSDIPANSSNRDDAPLSDPDLASSSPLGIVPHQIRGFLARFDNLKITGQAYDRCTGCSGIVIEAYEKDGIAMLLQAFDDASFLERLTGLDKLFAESEALMESVDWEEEDDEGSL